MVAQSDETSVVVREATPADAASVARLLDVLGYPDEVDAVRERLAAFATFERDAVLVAEHGGRVVGLVALNLTPTFAQAGWFSRLTAFAVDPDARRTGTGRALLAEAEHRAAAAGSRLMQLNCGRRPERAAAHEFYVSLGYRDQYDHHVLYDKPLGPPGER